MNTGKKDRSWFRQKCRDLEWRLANFACMYTYCARGWINVLRYQWTGKASVVCDFCDIVMTDSIGQVLMTRQRYRVVCEACYADRYVHEHFQRLDDELEYDLL